MRHRIPHRLIWRRTVQVVASQDDDRGTWSALHLGGHRFKRLGYGNAAFQAGIVAVLHEMRGGSDVAQAVGAGWEVCRRLGRFHRGAGPVTPLDVEYLLLPVEFPWR